MLREAVAIHRALYPAQRDARVDAVLSAILRDWRRGVNRRVQMSDKACRDLVRASIDSLDADGRRSSWRADRAGMMAGPNVE